MEQREVAKQAKAALALLTAPTSKGKKDSKKASAKKSSEKEKAFQKTKEGMALANASAPELCKEYQAVYNKLLPKRDHQEQVQSRCHQDVSFLHKLSVFGCQVLVEQDSPGADRG